MGYVYGAWAAIQGLFGLFDPACQLQNEIAPLDLFRNFDELFDQGHGVGPCGHDGGEITIKPPRD